MSEKQFNIVGLGEVLWDVLPSGKQLGGAPANFAYISDRLGNRGIVAGRVGVNTDGDEILQSLAHKGIDVSHIQKDAQHPTGTVKVQLENGQPSYEITETVAWDFLELNEDWRDLAKTCDAICFGTLAQRNAVSRQTIKEFLKLVKPNCVRIFDINLRQNYYSPEIIKDSLNLANVVKLNHDELAELSKMFAISNSDEIEKAKRLCGKFKIKFLCLTRGGNGSLLLTEDKMSEHRGIKVEIADTIGAGDSFSAAMSHGILRGWDLDEINEFANKVGAFVASQTGAMPPFDNFND
jgi:fructokinase